MISRKYEIRRSSRRTIGIEITPDGLLVRAPRRASIAEIERVLQKHSRWIDSHMQKLADDTACAAQAGPLTEAELQDLADTARIRIPERVAYYAPLIGIDPAQIGRITIRHQKTRWGSCSAKGNLNFNCLLMLTPPEVLDSVVVHELCHMKEMNHSARFYDEVLRVFPEYKKWHRWLKEHGGAILKRLPQR